MHRHTAILVRCCVLFRRISVSLLQRFSLCAAIKHVEEGAEEVINFRKTQNNSFIQTYTRTIKASPHNVPTANATRKRSTWWYAVDLVNGTIATPIRPHIEISSTDTDAYIQAKMKNYVYYIRSV